MNEKEGNNSMDEWSLIFYLLDHPKLLEFAASSTLEFAFLLLWFYYPVDLLALSQLVRVKLINLSFLLELDFQSFLLESFLMSKSFSEMMPFELRQVLHVPYVFSIETAFFVNHLLAIKRQSCKLSHSLISKLDPAFSETYSFVSSSLYSVFSGPLALSQ